MRIWLTVVACIQQVPNVSPTGRYTTIVPLGVVLIASAFKEIQEDLVSRVFSTCNNKLTRAETTRIRSVFEQQQSRSPSQPAVRATAMEEDPSRRHCPTGCEQLYSGRYGPAEQFRAGRTVLYRDCQSGWVGVLRTVCGAYPDETVKPT